MIKRRTRPQTTTRQRSLDVEDPKDTSSTQVEEEEPELPIAELIEWRKLRRAREGIDVAKLNAGDAKKKKKRPREEDQGGLRQAAASAAAPDGDEEGNEAKDAKARRTVRANNFTQQTNALDVDKHMMAYIEENLKVRSKPREEDEEEEKPYDPQDALYREVADRYKSLDRHKETAEEGNVTNSMAMLTAIPEVDLGMDTRLKNIEDTEKAKRVVAEERHGRQKVNADEEHLVATRFYRPNLRAKSDADILRDAKLEAMGLPPQEGGSYKDRTQTATDEMVMERFKKRMRK